MYVYYYIVVWGRGNLIGSIVTICGGLTHEDVLLVYICLCVFVVDDAAAADCGGIGYVWLGFWIVYPPYIIICVYALHANRFSWDFHQRFK